MKTTYSVTQAQSKLPGLLKSVNENAATYGITVHDDVKAYLIGKERMDSIMETLEILSNPDAAKALRDYESGAVEFHSLDDL
ncbi:MAG: PHD/YefM family antitoxin component YafN of YafNO toxin-antitoxin module [Candidatus Azotimanducaceae bacterium]|jgi:PHD/YefM family antitoxin component YafN of YafNO toxin-antitoxin module